MTSNTTVIILIIVGTIVGILLCGLMIYCICNYTSFGRDLAEYFAIRRQLQKKQKRMGEGDVSDSDIVRKPDALTLPERETSDTLSTGRTSNPFLRFFNGIGRNVRKGKNRFIKFAKERKREKETENDSNSVEEPEENKSELNDNLVKVLKAVKDEEEKVIEPKIIKEIKMTKTVTMNEPKINLTADDTMSTPSDISISSTQNDSITGESLNISPETYTISSDSEIRTDQTHHTSVIQIKSRRELSPQEKSTQISTEKTT